MALKDRLVVKRVLVISKRKKKLTLWKKPFGSVEFFPKSYDIAIGLPDYETPEGVFAISTKAKCPDWFIPDSQWVIDKGLTPGEIIAGCTDENPLKDRWLGFTDDRSVGIHGTASMESIGTKASHGCIRMKPDDVIKLYKQVPKGTPVHIY